MYILLAVQMTVRYWLLINLLCGAVTGSFASQEAPTVRDMLIDIWHDQGAILSSPARMDKQDAVLWGTGAAALIALLPEYNGHRTIDEKLIDGIDRENQLYGSFFKRLTYLGDGSVLFGASIATYGISSWSDYEGVQRFSTHWIEALADTTVWATLLKITGGRNRPQASKPESEFRGPKSYFKNEGIYSSFPSGHAALAFATAAVMTRESDNNPWIAVSAYGVAGGVGFSRMYVEKHWLSDVLFGAVLGHSIGTLVENRRHGKAGNTAFRIVPTADREASGLALVFQW